MRKNTIIGFLMMVALICSTMPNKVLKVHYRLGKERPISYQNKQWDYLINRSKTLRPETKQTVFFGDSRINGLCVESLFDAVNFGISGETIQNAANRIFEVHNLKGKRIVLAYGFNDLRYRTAEESIEDYREILHYLKDYELYLLEVLAEIGRENTELSKFNKELKSLSTEYGAIFISLKLNEKGYSEDNVHFTKSGNLEIANQIGEVLK